jgi:hypothetical protein
MQNITARIKVQNIITSLKKLMYSDAPHTDVESEYQSFIASLNDQNMNDAGYIADNFYLHRRQFWVCYTYMHCSFGCQSTQRIESYHSKLKSVLHKATSLGMLFDAVCSYQSNYSENKTARERRQEITELGGLAPLMVSVYGCCVCVRSVACIVSVACACVLSMCEGKTRIRILGTSKETTRLHVTISDESNCE